MAASPPSLTVVYSRQASRDLGEIWDWNAKRYDAAHATDYVLFLEANINALATHYREGNLLRNFPNLRQIKIRRNPRGNGHIAVYEVDEMRGIVNIVHVYHEAQDIQGRLEDERR